MSNRRRLLAVVGALVAFAALAVLLWQPSFDRPNGLSFWSSPKDRVAEHPGSLMSPSTLTSGNRVLVSVANGDGDLLSVRVVGFNGNAVEGCEVLGWSDTAQRVVSRVTDELGVVNFRADDGQGVVAAVHATGRWAMAHIEWSGEHVLALGGAAAVAGTVLVDGVPAPEGLELALARTAVAFPPELPRTVAGRVRELLANHHSLATTTPGGAFAFVGLAADWHGELILPASHWFVPTHGESWQPRRKQLLAPSASLVVSVTLLPAVVGSVTWHDDGSPVASANVQAVVEYEDATQTMGRGVSSNDGSFSLPLSPTAGSQQARWAQAGGRPVASVTTVTCWGVLGSSEDREVSASGSDSVAKPFTIRLQRAPKTHFSVFDQQGHAIVGARVNVAGSTKTDRHGRGYFRGPLRGRRVLLAGARGYAVVPAEETPANGSADSPLRFILPPVNRLNIRVEGLQSSAALHEVRIESSERLLGGYRKWAEFDEEFGGSKYSSGATRRTFVDGFERVETLTVALDDRGEAVVYSIQPAIECELMVRDQLRQILGKKVVQTPDFGGESAVVVTVDATKSRRLFGTVVTSRGEPLANAEVRLLADARRLHAWTGHDGSFGFDAIHTDAPIDLVVRASGYAGVRVSGLLRSDDGKRHQIRLAPGRTVTVHVTDQAGVAVGLFAKPRGFEDQEAQSGGVGIYRWSDLPQAVEFYATIQGREFAIQHDASNPVARLRVPVLGLVSVPTSGFPAARGWTREHCFVELRCIQHPERGRIRLSFSDDPDDRQYVLPGRYSAAVVLKKVLPGRRRELVATGLSSEVDVLGGGHTRIAFE